MAPPAGALDSILVLRRNGASVDRHHGVPSPHFQNLPMEANENRLLNRKSWGDRWNKAGKLPIDCRTIETSGLMVHPDYLNKYGTLSNGVLNKSVRQSETWLYGTVGARGAPTQRPSLFLYPGVGPSPPRFLNQKNRSPATFVALPVSTYSSSEKTITGHPIPLLRKQVTNSCLGNNQSEFRNFSRGDLGGSAAEGKKSWGKKNGISKDVLPKSGSSNSKGAIVANNSRNPDSYKSVKRNKIGGIAMNEKFIYSGERGQNKSKTVNGISLGGQSIDALNSSFETFRPELKGKEVKNRKYQREEGDNTLRRKSILEYDVDVYELNKSRSKDVDDWNNDDSWGAEQGRISDPVRANPLRPQPSKTDDKNVSDEKPESENRQHRGESITQRFGTLKEADNSKTLSNQGVERVDSIRKQAPDGSASPKRPPRRQKGKISLDGGLKLTKTRSKSSPNLSIKSILKKKSLADEESLPFVFASSNPERSLLPEAETVDPAADSQVPPKSHTESSIGLSMLKKKKQVQFRVNSSNESSNHKDVSLPEGTEYGEAKPLFRVPDKAGQCKAQGGAISEGNNVLRSKSCEDLTLSDLKKCCNELKSGTKDEVADVRGETGVIGMNGSKLFEKSIDLSKLSAEEKCLTEASGLRRSFSERRLTAFLTMAFGERNVASMSNVSASSPVFNDTMALRSRFTRLNTREMFPGNFAEQLINRNAEIVSRSQSQTKKKLPGKIISYAEFSKLPETFSEKKPKVLSKTDHQKPRVSLKSYKPAKTKSSFPSPPPRHKFPDKISVTVTAREFEKNENEPKTVAAHEETKANKLPESPQNDSSFKQTSVQEYQGSGGKTVVRLDGNVPENHENVDVNSVGRASVTIHARNSIEEPEDKIHRKTSVVISGFQAPDSNKVTISVRNSELYDEEPNSSTCTIIETGSNSTVIPVVSMDNKTTLIVGSSSTSATLHSTFSLSGDRNDVFSEVENLKNSYPPSPAHFPAEKYIACIDPVEAVKRNLIPHICGKGSDSSVPAADPGPLTKERKESDISVDVPAFEPLKNDQLLLNSIGSKCEYKGSFHSSGMNSPQSEEDSSAITSQGSSILSAFDSSTSKKNSSDGAGIDNSEGSEKDETESDHGVRHESTGSGKHPRSIREATNEEFSDENNRTEKLARDARAPISGENVPTASAEDKKDTQTVKSMFEGATKYDILNYLVDAKERVREDAYLNETTSSAAKSNEQCEAMTAENEGEGDSGNGFGNGLRYSCDDSLTGVSQTESESLKTSRKSSAEIERNDSGVGSETSHASRSRWQTLKTTKEDTRHLCEDCDQTVDTRITDGNVMYVPMVCRKCSKKRAERKDIIHEILETEEKYGRDLKIVLEEFYTPMLVAGLLSSDQLSSIFLNTEELLENSKLLTERLRDMLEMAADQGDEDLFTVNVGKLFLESEPMLHAFESYCTRQGAAAMLLAGLEKEKELLRIFLRVSQMENAVLRRMNLNSFLMVPVQRVTKYPLLLARLYKVTPAQQEGKELLREAQHNIELHLEHMNSEAKDVSGTKVWRRFSTSAAAGRKFTTESDMVNIKLRKMAVDVLDWNHEEVRFILEGKLLYTQPTDNNWKRGRTLKLNPVYVLLVTLGKPNSKYRMETADDELTFPVKTGIREATLLLVKEKCGRYTLIREPLYLDKIIVCCETESDEYFEIQELLTKESFIFKAEDGEKTKEWYKQLQYHAQILGAWRKRRNALANIMINGMLMKACAT